MKIILAVNTFGSFISHRRSLYLELIKKHDVLVIFPQSEDCPALREAIPQSHLILLPLKRRGINPIYELYTIYSFYRVYRSIQPDLIHHFTIKPVIYGTIAALMSKAPRIVNSITGLGFIFTSKSIKAMLLGFIVKNLYRLCFYSEKVKIIFQNTDDRDFFTNAQIVPETRCILIPGSGVDVHFYQPHQTQNKIPIIFTASRLLKEKGISELVDALRLLKEKAVPFKAWIAGDPDPANPGTISPVQIKQWKSENIATFLGHQKDMLSLLNQVDIACLPSYREGLPMSLLEAMASGKPIVTTDAPGCRETVQINKNGYIVPVQNSEKLALALESLLKNDQLRIQFGAESRRLAVERFSKEIINQKIIAVYDSFFLGNPG